MLTPLRSGHYDILYKAADAMLPIAPPVTNEAAVYRQSHAAKHFVMTNPANIDPNFEIPGMHNLGIGYSAAFSPSPIYNHYDTSSPPVSPMYMSPQHQSLSIGAPSDQAYSLSMHPAPVPAPATTMSHDYAQPNMQFESISLPLSQPPAPSDPFRFNDFHYRQGYNDPNTASILACQTNIFRK